MKRNRASFHSPEVNRPWLEIEHQDLAVIQPDLGGVGAAVAVKVYQANPVPADGNLSRRDGVGGRKRRQCNPRRRRGDAPARHGLADDLSTGRPLTARGASCSS